MKNHQLMRASLEELAPLRWLWQRVGFTTVELEKSLTDFYLLIDEVTAKSEESFDENPLIIETQEDAF